MPPSRRLPTDESPKSAVRGDVAFIGFCPGGDFGLRRDGRWRKLGICEFDYDGSPIQTRRFASIRVGDRVILKKNQVRGKTMRLFGHGEVTAIDFTPEGRRFLRVRWHPDDSVIEVPLLGCNATVNVRNAAAVLDKMPEEFRRWFKAKRLPESR